MSRSRARKKQSTIQLVRHGQQHQEQEHDSYQRGYRADNETRPPVLIPLPDEITPILEAARSRKKNGMRSISQAWDDTEALGITADMRRSGPGMLSDQDRKDTLYKAFLNSVWISACVDVISKRITSGGYTIEYCGKNEHPTPEEEQQKEQLQAFVDYTNDDEDFLQLIRGIVTDILIYGECYVEIVKQNGVPYSLHKIDCITMNYQIDPHGAITKYIQNMYHSTTTIDFAPDEVIRFWLPSPNASKIALSPIERIMGSIDADVHMADWVRSFFRKGARPNFWIKFPGPKEEADRFVAWLRENYTGMANAHVPLVLFDEAELYEIGKGSVDVDFLKGREQTCKEILAGYQVPPALVGLIESGNIGGGTGESQEKSFLRNACDPIKATVFGQINYRVTQQGFGITCWRLSTHYADYRDDSVVGEIADKRIRNGSLNINEVRRDMNRPPVEGGDVNVVVTSREIQPLDRLDDLSNEQAAQAQATTARVQAQATLAQAQADKLKEPPPEPMPPLAPPAQPNPPGEDKQQQADAVERHLLRAQLSALIERLEQHTRTDDVRHEAAQLLADLLNQARPAVDDEPRPQIAEALANIDEQLRALRAQDVTPRRRSRKKIADSLLTQTEPTPTASAEPVRNALEEDAVSTEPALVSKMGTCTCPMCMEKHGQSVSGSDRPPYHDGCDCTLARSEDVHTGMMVAFMLDPETASQLAIPDGEPADILHITLAYLGDMQEKPEDGLLRAHASPEQLKQTIRMVAAQFEPLQGHIAGIGRFDPSEEDMTPVIALPDVPGLSELRNALVDAIQAAGYFVATNHGYTPHITLAYIDKNADMPVTSTPARPLSLNAVCLVIGDTQTDFPLGGGQEIHAGESGPPTIESELARWQQRALVDVQTQGWRVFESEIVPPELIEQIRPVLWRCQTVQDVRDVFERASSKPAHNVILRGRIHELFMGIAERGRKALEEGGES